MFIFSDRYILSRLMMMGSNGHRSKIHPDDDGILPGFQLTSLLKKETNYSTIDWN